MDWCIADYAMKGKKEEGKMGEYEELTEEVRELRREISKLVSSVHDMIDKRIERQAKACRELWGMEYKISTTKIIAYLAGAGLLGGGFSEILNHLFGG